MTKIPLLDQDIAAGTGKLGRHANMRLTSGTEAGIRVVDIEFVHEIQTPDEAQLLDSYVPGAADAYEASREEEEDGHGSRRRGKRPYTWTPEQGNVALVLCPSPGGPSIYQGPAELRRAVLRNTPKNCTLTVYLRLHGVKHEGDHLNRLAQFLGQLVDYEMTATRIEGAAGEGVDGQDGLPFQTTSQGVPVAVGNLIVAAIGEDLDTEVIGLVASVHAGGAVVYESFDRSTDAVEVPLDKILSVHQLTGKLGGVFDPTLMPPGLLGRHLLAAITSLAAAESLKIGSGGWPIGRLVIDDANERLISEQEGGDIPEAV